MDDLDMALWIFFGLLAGCIVIVSLCMAAMLLGAARAERRAKPARKAPASELLDCGCAWGGVKYSCLRCPRSCCKDHGEHDCPGRRDDLMDIADALEVQRAKPWTGRPSGTRLGEEWIVAAEAAFDWRAAESLPTRKGAR